jgi:DNA invertase Pin-like site-specific DNA recombinase
MRAVAYIRRSKDPGDGNASLVDQRTWIVEESRKRGHELSDGDIFEEVVSAYRDRSRPQRERLEAVLKEGGVTALYVRDLDRLARRLMDTARIVDTCDRHEVTIYTHDRVFAPRSPDTVLLVSVLGGLAQTEAATTSKRLKRTAESIRQKGGWNGMAPYGWVLPKDRNENGVKTLSLHPEESLVVRQMVDWRLAGLSVAEIVRELRDRDLTNRGGRPFQYRAVASLLRHPLLAGYNSVTTKAKGSTDTAGPDFRDTREIVYDKDGDPVKSHAAVCTPSEWESLRLLMKPQPLKKTRARAGGLPLTGLVYCGVCGSKMTSNRSLGASGAYLCNGRARGERCPGNAITAGALQQFVLDVVATSLDAPEILEFQAERLRQLATGNLSAELNELHDKSDALGESIRILQGEVRTAPAVAVGALLSRIGEEEALKSQLDQRISEQTEGRPRRIPSMSGDQFRTRPEAAQRVVIRAFIRKIVIYPDDGYRGSVKGMFGSQGTNLSRIGFWYLGEGDDVAARRGAGYSLRPSDGEYQCPDCEQPRIFRYKNNLRHHQNYAHPKSVPCPECGDLHPLPGLPSHRRNRHGVSGGAL